ncbi:MAG: MmgE/PrpD [Sphingomonas sp. 28-62-20]|uniref:MmgE/PrpD family protein n=1 Tax=Sphingomonas sp. 28-62-20 TaxID=1970433 RepID=UPI000BCEF594|nr:MAG: MmgE/PrpD [Sphingomonas sp. 28-62-20]
MSATAALLDFVRAHHVLPPETRADAARLLADTLAVGAAGSTAPGAAGVLAAAMGWGAGEDARLIGSSGRLPAASAAFVNAFRIHCLEWDAVHEPAVVHALSVVTAALGASIDRMGGCDPETALAGLAVGVDVASGLGIAATSPLKFFRPATAGCIGAAMAVARIEGVEPLEDVLGLANSFCAGTMQAHVEGSIALPLQVANAARSAIMAVDLAKAGLSGPHDALEGPFGYFRLIDDGQLVTYTHQIGARWLISEVSTKPYPSGRASHGALGAIAASGVAPDDIAWIELFAPPLIKRLVGRPFTSEMTPAYARLCLPLLSALMLTDGCIDPRRFMAATFADPAIADLAGRIIVNDDGTPDPNALSPQRMVVTLKDGTTIERTIPATLGSPDAPLSAEQTAAKRDLAALLAPGADPRLFDSPIAWFTEPA